MLENPVFGTVGFLAEVFGVEDRVDEKGADEAPVGLAAAGDAFTVAELERVDIIDDSTFASLGRPETPT